MSAWLKQGCTALIEQITWCALRPQKSRHCHGDSGVGRGLTASYSFKNVRHFTLPHFTWKSDDLRHRLSPMWLGGCAQNALTWHPLIGTSRASQWDTNFSCRLSQIGYTRQQCHRDGPTSWFPLRSRSVRVVTWRSWDGITPEIQTIQPNNFRYGMEWGQWNK